MSGSSCCILTTEWKSSSSPSSSSASTGVKRRKKLWRGTSSEVRCETLEPLRRLRRTLVSKVGSIPARHGSTSGATSATSPWE